MVIGALIVLYPSLKGFSGGEPLILLASFIAPLGNYFQKRARKKVSSEYILFIRSLVSAVVIILLSLILQDSFSYTDIGGSFIFLLINGLFLLGFSKILWVEGIHRISITKANALSSMSPLVTLLFAWILLQQSPTIWQLLSFTPMSFGMILLGMNQKNPTEETNL